LYRTNRAARPLNQEIPLKIGSAFPSKFLKADDLRGRAVKLTIDSVQMEKLDDGEKPVLFFLGKEKGLVLNRTNSDVLADAFGHETDDWANREIEVYPDKTHYQGKLVACLRVRVPVPAAAAADGESTPF